MLTLYLAGAIRDNHPEDIAWREDIITALHDLPIRVMNPLGGRHFNPKTRQWTLRSGQPDSAKMIVKQDFWCIDHSDVVIFNFLALSEGYPNIGTLIELGRATSRNILIYSIIAPAFKGHENPQMYRLHPFLEETGAVIFPTVGSCRVAVREHLQVLTGIESRYDAGRITDDSYDLFNWIAPEPTGSRSGKETP